MLPVIVAGAAIALAATRSFIKYRGENIFRSPSVNQVRPAANNQHDIAEWIKEHIEKPEHADSLLRIVSSYFGNRISKLQGNLIEIGRLVEDPNKGHYYDIVVEYKKGPTTFTTLRIPAVLDENGKPILCYEPGDFIYSFTMKDITEEGMTNMYLDKVYE